MRQKTHDLRAQVGSIPTRPHAYASGYKNPASWFDMGNGALADLPRNRQGTGRLPPYGLGGPRPRIGVWRTRGNSFQMWCMADATRVSEANNPEPSGSSGMKRQGAGSPPANRTHPGLRPPLQGGDNYSKLPLDKVLLSGGMPEGRDGTCSV